MEGFFTSLAHVKKAVGASWMFLNPLKRSRLSCNKNWGESSKKWVRPPLRSRFGLCIICSQALTITSSLFWERLVSSSDQHVCQTPDEPGERTMSTEQNKDLIRRYRE